VGDGEPADLAVGLDVEGDPGRTLDLLLAGRGSGDTNRVGGEFSTGILGWYSCTFTLLRCLPKETLTSNLPDNGRGAPIAGSGTGQVLRVVVI
jgi:hypothetical protein